MLLLPLYVKICHTFAPPWSSMNSIFRFRHGFWNVRSRRSRPYFDFRMPDQVLVMTPDALIDVGPERNDKTSHYRLFHAYIDWIWKFSWNINYIFKDVIAFTASRRVGYLHARFPQIRWEPDQGIHSPRREIGRDLDGTLSLALIIYEIVYRV
jgi:hypothetical protein